MRAISLWQPWASLWVSGRKVHETRGWKTPHRGWLVVHATKRFERNFAADDPIRGVLDDEFGGHWGLDLPTGALIGVVDIVDCVPTKTLFGNAVDDDDDLACGDFSEGRFAWRSGWFVRFDQPIPYRGRQSMFSVPDDILPEWQQ